MIKTMVHMLLRMTLVFLFLMWAPKWVMVLLTSILLIILNRALDRIAELEKAEAVRRVHNL